ncbi:uncharacterized protein LOC108090331 [Drosophila ficusphila]|uniref:uncharacterized protein LOC108090331 n=1 Tax=Drosophila ficusphila TaxID=30025 RepID=UPI0007E6ACD2|nr:uncharacterized protein LOC108090331 [Drosophila ficusphila]
MLPFSVPFLLFVGIFVYLYDDCAARNNWEATPISISGSTTNPSDMDMDLRIEHKARDFSFSGTFFWNIDMDDNVMVEMRILSSYSGKEEDYKMTPWSIPPQKFVDYIETFYKDIIMANLGDCTDLPRYDDGYVPPWPKATYNFTRCTMNGKGLPEVLAEGFYRAEAVISSPPSLAVNLSVVVRIRTKMF